MGIKKKECKGRKMGLKGVVRVYWKKNNKNKGGLEKKRRDTKAKAATKKPDWRYLESVTM